MISWFDKLSGTSFRQNEIDMLTGEETLVLIAEPENEYDEYAVRVEADGMMIGFIRKGHNEKISKALQSGKEVAIEEFTITGGQDGMNYGVNVKIAMESEAEYKNFEKLFPDIGEGFVYFDKENHEYFNEQGDRMTSGSMLEKEEIGESDLSYAAKAMAKSTRIPEKKIVEMWERNGELSAAFGTVVHDALDFYIKNQVDMQAYDDIKERPHTAANWMPNSVGHIVDKYLENHDVEASRGEVFVRFGNFCGSIDHLVYESEKTVFIRDYKIINELKSAKTKNFGKQDKYTVQLNTYRAILEANGYTVSGMELNIFDGEEWKDVKVERIDINVETSPGQ